MPDQGRGKLGGPTFALSRGKHGGKNACRRADRKKIRNNSNLRTEQLNTYEKVGEAGLRIPKRGTIPNNRSQ